MTALKQLARFAAAAAFGVLLTLSPALAEPVRIVMLGDSLTAGYGLPPGQALPARLEAALKSRGHEVVIDNAGVSGDTASGGLARLDWSVAADTQGVIVALGANDMLRGLDPKVTREALTGIVEALKGRKLPVLLTGLVAPRNYGPDYQRTFDAIFPDLARAHDLVYYPFLLDGVALDPSLNQPDGIHPNERGVAVMVQRMLPSVEALLQRVRAAG